MQFLVFRLRAVRIHAQGGMLFAAFQKWHRGRGFMCMNFPPLNSFSDIESLNTTKRSLDRSTE
jgi:hypothetical protein